MLFGDPLLRDFTQRSQRFFRSYRS